MWLDDPVTQALIFHLNKQIKDKTGAVFSARRSAPQTLPDSVAELELATTLRDTINTGKFLN